MPPISASAAMRSASWRTRASTAASCNGRWRSPPAALFALRHRRAVAAHARRLFHHDHARLRADGLLHRRRPRRATAATTASPSTSAASSWRRSICRTRSQFYYLCLALLLGAIYLVWRAGEFALRHGGAGRRAPTTRACARSAFRPIRYRLVCFVIAGTLCGLAGALLANHTDFVSPAMMHWTRSGDLIVMVVLGGMGSLFGPVIGAVALLVLEEVLLRHHRILADHPRAAAAAGRAVRARRHRRAAARGEGRRQPKCTVWLSRCSQVERPDASASAASSPPTI